MTLLPIDYIMPNPDQPRRHFDEAALGELADSIKAVGLLEPIIVRPVEGQPYYEIIAGERRWRAAGLAHLSAVDAVIRRDVDDHTAFEMSLIENVIRADMNPIEEADGFHQLIVRGLDVETIATRIGKSVAAIRARLALLRLALPIRDLVRTGQMDAYDAGHVARLSTEGQYRVVRAMNEGSLTRVGDLARLARAIYAEEAQGSMFGEAEVETLRPEQVKAAHGLREALDRALAAVAQAHEQLDAGAIKGADPEAIALIAEGLSLEAKRVARRAHVARAEATARQTTGGLA